MNCQVSEGEKYQKVLTIEVPVEEMEPILAETIKKISKTVRINGFRKGKMPRTVIENYVGKDYILAEASEEIMNMAYNQALDETGIIPVAQPGVEILEIKPGCPLKFAATVTVYPDVKLGQYKEIPVTRTVLEVTDEDIDQALEDLRNRYSSIQAALEDDIVGNGDIVDLNYKGTKDGVAFDGGTASNYSLEIGSHTFIPGFEEAMIGMKAKETKVIPLTFPENYGAKELAGQAVEFEVTVNEIKKKVSLELTDPKFIEQASETANTLEELRAELKEQLLERNRKQGDTQARNEVLLQVIKNCEADVPPAMIENQLDTMVEDLKNDMAQEGLKIEDYLSETGMTMESLRDSLRERATIQIKRDMVITEIMKAETIELSDEEMDKEYNEIGQQYGMDASQLKSILEQNGALDEFEDSIRKQKAANLTYDTAVITDEYITKEEFRKRNPVPGDIGAQLQKIIEEEDAKAESDDAEAIEAIEAVVESEKNDAE